MSKWIEFEDVGASKSGITRKWQVVSKESDGCLGWVVWYPQWRRYAFLPKGGTIFEEECLCDIADFIEHQTIEHKKARKAAKT